MYKCPFHYIGSKARLLDQIIPLINSYQPETVVDLFAGGFSVGLNVDCKNVICNDKNTKFIELLQWLYNNDGETVIKEIEDEINSRQLSKTNKTAYNKLKADYNKTNSPKLLFLLISYSFNHQMRFNQNNAFNTPFGMNRSSFNKPTKTALANFIKCIQEKQVTFSSVDFSQVNNPKGKVLVFVDPPYFLSTGSYNDGNRGIVSWTEEDEKKLYQYLDELNKNGIAFVLTNFVESNGIENPYLRSFIKKYKYTYTQSNYKNSNYHKKKIEDVEIIVRNFL